MRTKSKIIVAGSRSIEQYQHIEFAIKYTQQKLYWEFAEMLNGNCGTGVDALAVRYATENNITLDLHPANWKAFGKIAGFRRNNEMAALADKAIILWDGASRDIENMRNCLVRHKKEYIQFTYKLDKEVVVKHSRSRSVKFWTVDSILWCQYDPNIKRYNIVNLWNKGNGNTEMFTKITPEIAVI